MSEGYPASSHLWMSAAAAAMASVTVVAPTEILAITYIFGLPLALIHILVLGLPGYLLLRERRPLTWWRSMLGGLVVGAAPWTLISLVSGTRLREIADVIASTGVPGAAGGLAFWAVLAMGRAPQV